MRVKKLSVKKYASKKNVKKERKTVKKQKNATKKQQNYNKNEVENVAQRKME